MALSKLCSKINCARSTILLLRNLSFDSSQNGSVVCRDVGCVALREEANSIYRKMFFYEIEPYG